MVYDLLNFNHSPHILNYRQVCRLLSDFIKHEAAEEMLATILNRLLPAWLRDTQQNWGSPGSVWKGKCGLTLTAKVQE